MANLVSLPAQSTVLHLSQHATAVADREELLCVKYWVEAKDAFIWSAKATRVSRVTAFLKSVLKSRGGEWTRCLLFVAKGC